MVRKPDPAPKGLKNIWNAGIGAGESLLKLPQDLRGIVIAGVTVMGLVLLVVVGTAAYSVASGRVDVNEVMKSGAEISKNVGKASAMAAL